MNEKELFPKEFIDSSIEHFTNQIKPKTQALFLFLIVTFYIFIFLLPFIKIDIYKYVSGLVTTPTGPAPIYSHELAPIDSILINEDERVREGDTLVKFDVSIWQHEVNELNQRKIRLQKVIENLEVTSKSVSNELSKVELKEYLLSEVYQINKELTSLNERISKGFLVAPISGICQNVMKITKGQNLKTNEKLLEISPDDSLIVICYIRPEDIFGLEIGQRGTFELKTNSKLREKVFTGQVIDISEGTYILNGNPYYKLKCSLDDINVLTFNSKIIKDVKVRGAFLVDNKSLLELINSKLGQ